MKKLNLEIIFYVGIILFVAHALLNFLFKDNFIFQIVSLTIFIVWLWSIVLCIHQAKKKSKLGVSQKNYKELAGSLTYMGGHSYAVLRIYKDKLVIKEVFFRLVLLLLNKKDIVIPKDDIKQIILLNKWPYYGINIITKDFVSEELVFSIRLWKEDKEQWQKILGEYDYKIE